MLLIYLLFWCSAILLDSVYYRKANTSPAVAQRCGSVHKSSSILHFPHQNSSLMLSKLHEWYFDGHSLCFCSLRGREWCHRSPGPITASLGSSETHSCLVWGVESDVTGRLDQSQRGQILSHSCLLELSTTSSGTSISKETHFHFHYFH